jgi:flagellar biosynthesis protein FliR
VNELTETTVLTFFLIFCRFGSCLIFAPGFSNSHIPPNIRALLAAVGALALMPLLYGSISAEVAMMSSASFLGAVVHEVAIGAFVGLMARLFMLALQFAASVSAGMIGLAGIPGASLEDVEAGSPLATIATLAATVAIFSLNLHAELLKAVIGTYDVLPLAAYPSIEAVMNNVTELLSQTFVLALRLSAPFIAYGIMSNFSIAMANRFAPQISFYHATSAVVILVGLLIFYLVWPTWISSFVDQYGAWLVRGGFS